ncbi:hypothetical protein CsSME_00044612 [Camellia sinensis var. sinensis]
MWVVVLMTSGGNELFPICAVNTIDNEKPPTFNCMAWMKYPDWFSPIPPQGCDCIGGCLDSQKCSCVLKNGGEIPYNYNGAIVESKTLVYECGPSCKCPPSCYNRVSQHGIKLSGGFLFVIIDIEVLLSLDELAALMNHISFHV